MGWIRDNILGGANADFVRRDPDFGTALPPLGARAIPAEADPHALEEQLVAAAERCDEVKDGLETAIHGPADPLHPDIGGAGLGFVRGVLIRVLAHVIASPDRKADG